MPPTFHTFATRTSATTDDPIALPPLIPEGIPSLDAIGRFLHCLARRVSDYYDNRCEPAGCTGRQPNYEDFVYLAVQISEAINRERDNPALRPFVESVTAELDIHGDALRVLADEAVALIHDYVTVCLAGLSPTENHLHCLQDSVRAAGEDFIPVFTLNHDCVIEKVLRADQVVFNDMTRSDKAGRRVLCRKPSRKGVNLFKLHGSTDWFRWRPIKHRNDGFWSEWQGALDLQPTQAIWRSDIGRPLILLGRFNKELTYAHSPFAEILAWARFSLARVSRLMVSGYSFGDKAINTMLIDWLYARRHGTRRIVLAHRDPETLQRGARGAIAQKWQEWLKDGVLVVIPSHLSDVTPAELLEAL